MRDTTEFWLVGEMRQRAADNKGIAGLGMDKVERPSRSKPSSRASISGVWYRPARLICAQSRAALLYAEFSQAIVCLHHLCRLYEECLARSRLVVYDTVDFALVHRSHGVSPGGRRAPTELCRGRDSLLFTALLITRRMVEFMLPAQATWNALSRQARAKRYP